MIRISLKGSYIYLSIVATSIGLTFLVFTLLSCNDDGSVGNGNGSSSAEELLAKSEPDECFCGIGAEDNGPISNSATGDCSDLTPEEPLTVCLPKRNYSYIWGLTKIGSQIWFGTLQNTLCVFGSGFNPLLQQEPELGDNAVCEYQESYLASMKPLPILGDLRTPKIMVYDTQTGLTQEISVDNCEGGSELLEGTLGLRQAGSFTSGDFEVVILAGPSLSGSINMFAFDPRTRVCLAARNFPQYNDARNNMIVVDGVLYSTVGKSIDDENPEGGGRVLRYVGDIADPLRWEEVGKLDTIGAALTFHEGRIFVGTWPNITVALADPGVAQAPNLLNGPRPGIFMGPVVPPGGLTSANFNDWVKVWQTSDYEPDLTTSATYGIGDIESYGGKLWWGTLHVPLVAFAVHIVFLEFDLADPDCSSDPVCSARYNLAFVETRRASAIFRGSNFDSTPEIELLYGESSLPAFNASTGQWEEKQNNMSAVPLFGQSGFNNSQNFYTWNMEVFGDRLYVATFENQEEDFSPGNALGADLFRFRDLNSAAEPVSLDGFGNFFNYGFRTLLSDEDGKDGDHALYIGTANPFNLAPEGGWELWRLR
jgi:hypothetical protein